MEPRKRNQTPNSIPFRAVVAGLAGIAVVLMALAWPAPARAITEIDITRGNVEPLPIAVSDLAGRSEMERNLGADIAEVVAADLERSGLFRPIDRRAFQQKPEDMQVMPRFVD